MCNKILKDSNVQNIFKKLFIYFMKLFAVKLPFQEYKVFLCHTSKYAFFFKPPEYRFRF